MMTGAINGERMKALIAFLPGKRPRTSPIAAGVPRQVASTMTVAPIQMLSQAASSQSARPKKLRYHCRLKPGGGKLR